MPPRIPSEQIKAPETAPRLPYKSPTSPLHFPLLLPPDRAPRLRKSFVGAAVLPPGFRRNRRPSVSRVPSSTFPSFTLLRRTWWSFSQPFPRRESTTQDPLDLADARALSGRTSSSLLDTRDAIDHAPIFPLSRRAPSATWPSPSPTGASLPWTSWEQRRRK
jgi:hypothetical protein